MKKTKSGTIHCIGNAHIDPVWLWRWQEGYQETRATFRSALDRMKEFPDFVFTASQAAVYSWIEESDPEMFKEIQQRVKEGRWAIVNGWWMEPDCNIPSGESFARQSLYGQQYFKEKFGKNCLSGYCVDSFGHNSMLPELLKQGGFEYYVFMRPGKFENPQCPEGPFIWKSADGSRVLAFRLLSAYGSGPEDINDEMMSSISSHFTGQIQDEMFFYGVGDHGGGPTIANIKSIQDMQQNPDLPEFVFSSPDEYFKTLLERDPKGTDKLPVYEGELQMHAVGCYAVQSGVKKWNRKAENVLIQAERWSSISKVVANTPYPGEELKKAWQRVLFNQFHDILAGSSIREAYEDARDSYGIVFQTAAEKTNCALQRISRQIDTSRGETAIVVYNNLPHPVHLPVEHELMVWHLGGKPLTLVDDTGKDVLWQKGTMSATVPGGWRVKIGFIADVPALGYRVYYLNSTETTAAQSSGFKVTQPEDIKVNGYEIEADTKPDLWVENECLQVEFDGHTGAIKHLINKQDGNDVISGPAAKGVVVIDPSDTWSHGLTAYHNDCGIFSDAKVKVVDEGPEQIIVRAKSFYGSSTLIQDFHIYKTIPWIEVKVTVDWHEKNKVFKLAFPVNTRQPKATFEVPYGTLERPVNGREVPGQRWFDVTGEMEHGTAGLSILNDSKYSFDVLGSEMRLTVLRSPVYAHHVPQKLEADKEYIYMDQGVQEFTYILLPHVGAWQEAKVDQLAELLNMPPICLNESIHTGSLPSQKSFISTPDNNDIEINVLKVSEDGKDLIVRCRETVGKKIDTTLNLAMIHREIPISLTPWQIKTVRIPWDQAAPIVETNFLEE